MEGEPTYSKNDDKDSIFDNEEKKNSDDLHVPLLRYHSDHELRFYKKRNTNPPLLINSKKNFRFSVINLDSHFGNKFNENESILEEKFSLKKLIIFFCFVMISSIQMPIYRKYCFDIQNTEFINYQPFNSYFFEIVIYSWRLQVIFLFLIIYLLISRILNLNKYSENELTDRHIDLKRKLSISPRNGNINILSYLNSNKFSSNLLNLDNNTIKLEWDKLLNLANLKFGIMNFISTGSIFYSTKFLPLSLVILFNAMNVIATYRLFLIYLHRGKTNYLKFYFNLEE
jgi:hypothetical protein